MDGNAGDAKYWIAVYMAIDNIAKIIPQNPRENLAINLQTHVGKALDYAKAIVDTFFAPVPSNPE